MGHHLGSRVSLLLDGRLGAGETERAWAHVHTCYACRDAVEREGWLKTRLACLQHDPGPVPPRLKGSLLEPVRPFAPATCDDEDHLDDLVPQALPAPGSSRPRRALGVLALSGGAAGAAVVGVLALGAAPAEAPVAPRQARLVPLVAPTATPAIAPGRQRP